MVIIFPSDSSTAFLSNIIDGISAHLNIDVEYPQLHLFPIEETINKIREEDSTRTIIYLGHGTRAELNTANGIDETITLHYAKRAFQKKKLILLSCFSSGFLENLNGEYNVAIGFGNIPTSKSELINAAEYLKYQHENFKCLDDFKVRLAKIFKDSIIKAYKSKYTFIELYNYMRLLINKSICNCSLSVDEKELLVGELMFHLKREMKLFGNQNALVFDYQNK